MSVLLVRVAFGGAVRGEDDLMRAQRMGQAGERHLLPGVEGVEERLELCLVGMVRDVAGIEHLHGQLAPLALVQAAELRRMEFVVEQAALAPDEMDVEVIRLEAA